MLRSGIGIFLFLSSLFVLHHILRSAVSISIFGRHFIYWGREKTVVKSRDYIRGYITLIAYIHTHWTRGIARRWFLRPGIFSLPFPLCLSLSFSAWSMGFKHLVYHVFCLGCKRIRILVFSCLLFSFPLFVMWEGG